MASEIWNILNYSRGPRGVVPKVVRNCSILYSFQDKGYFQFLPEFKPIAEICKILNFSEVLEQLSLVPRGPKFA